MQQKKKKPVHDTAFSPLVWVLHWNFKFVDNSTSVVCATSTEKGNVVHVVEVREEEEKKNTPAMHFLSFRELFETFQRTSVRVRCVDPLPKCAYVQRDASEHTKNTITFKEILPHKQLKRNSGFV